MKKLKDILAEVEVINSLGSMDVKVAAIEFDSRKCAPKTLFVAVKGTQVDGHLFIPKSIEMGATVIVCENFPGTIHKDITYLQVANTSKTLGILSSYFFDNPSQKLKLIGVTGTNGKTTIVSLLFSLVRQLGYKAGMLSTIENKIEDSVIGSTHTTPDPVQINNLMSKMVEEGCTYCLMEVSSHAADQDRIAGLHFSGGIFTNLTHDHLDYHKTFDAYITAKKKFFDNLPKEAFALSNSDDKNGNVVLQNSKASKYTYALRKPADFKGRIIENQFEGLQLNINNTDVWSKLVGEFNAYNILAVFGAAILSGENEEEVLREISALEIVNGRFDYIRSLTNIGIVDYAHTPDALKNVLETINAIRTRNETLITIFGAGGDRDPEKRHKMGKVAAELSDKIIITSDNPRSEDPEMIIDQIKEGIEPQNSAKVLSITNRKEAIKTGCMLAQPNDIILLAGKGHEKYQEIKGVKYPFDDKKILKEFLMIKPTNN
ncbi:MAG: UDP-N-acetylmuramoyl-L-alanyl-D-glutamate--2,6-diaminopimelate ligase [Bacteroidales bacterium]|nr:UDP-N-acetylmuramoyl-L-alanyl-D-glutamate--2,6-diaminopimelate ligase [Bacteroidales bacterium]MCF8404458.1 UDP-N-acetylmuramoyl-L-alanyl-D-glutamate--2,6-diaminopimelate ligase [Bacteroidales bacterium]